MPVIDRATWNMVKGHWPRWIRDQLKLGQALANYHRAAEGGSLEAKRRACRDLVDRVKTVRKKVVSEFGTHRDWRNRAWQWGEDPSPKPWDSSVKLRLLRRVGVNSVEKTQRLEKKEQAAYYLKAARRHTKQSAISENIFRVLNNIQTDAERELQLLIGMASFGRDMNKARISLEGRLRAARSTGVIRLYQEYGNLYDMFLRQANNPGISSNQMLGLRLVAQEFDRTNDNVLRLEKQLGGRPRPDEQQTEKLLYEIRDTLLPSLAEVGRFVNRWYLW